MDTWSEELGGFDRENKQPGIKFIFARETEEGKALCFQDCTMKFHPKSNLQKILIGLLGQKRFDSIKESDEKLKDALNECVGRTYLLTTIVHTTNSGKQNNKFVAVGIDEDSEAPQNTPEDDEIPF